MTASLGLLLEDFLGLMREEGELDAFLPLLMSAMGQQVVYRAQKGARQYGVDIVSVGADVKGQKTLFLWLVKCGNIGRTDWNSGPQSVRQSIDDVGDVYLRSHIAPEHRDLQKKLLVVTNGDFASNLNETIAGYLDRWCARHGASAEQFNGSRIAALTQEHLLSEYVLAADHRPLLRRTLANIASPEICVRVGRSLINALLESGDAKATSKQALKKQQLLGLRGARTALQVLTIWAQNEGNLRPAYILAQYSILAVWSRHHKDIDAGDVDVASEFSSLLFDLASVAEKYHGRLDPYYVVQDGFANALPDSLLVSVRVFEELGWLAQQGCFFAYYAGVAPSEPFFEAVARRYADRAKSLVQSHSCTGLPAFDHHSTAVHAAMLLLSVVGELQVARTWLRNLVQRLHYAATMRRFLPMNAEFDDALEVRHESEEMPDDFCSTSTLIPIILFWSAALDVPDAYRFIREQIVQRLPGTTPNLWNLEADFDSVVGSGPQLHEHGIGEGTWEFPEDPEAFLQEMCRALPEVPGIESTVWYRQRAPYIPLLAALHWEAQLPREMMAKQGLAFARWP